MPYTDFSTLHVDIERGVATVTIDHPPLNVLDAALMTDLDRFAVAVQADEGVQVIIVQSADPEFFIAHGDMHFLDDPEAFATLPLGDLSSPLNPMMRLHERFRALPQLTIAKLAGLARGGGSEFAMALDLRFAATGRAALGQFEALTGIIPGAGGTAYLPLLVGRARALEVILGGELLNAQQAERYGWINRALPEDQLDAFVETLARRIAALPPGVVAAVKSAVDAALTGTLTDALHLENTLLGELFGRPVAGERTRAALAAGAQMRDGERDLEGLLNSL